MIKGGRRFAASCLMVLLLWGGAPPVAGESAQVVAVGVASSEKGPEQPSLERFAVGYARIAEQLAAGRALSAQLSASPGYLPIADRGAANALRQMLALTQVRYVQRGLGTESDQKLYIWAEGDPVLTLSHSARGERRVWSSPELMPDGIETPETLHLFAELLGQSTLGEAVFFAPPDSAVEDAGQFETLWRLLETAEGQDFTVSAEVSNRIWSAWGQDPAFGMLLRPVFSGWRVVSQTRISRELDAQGRWAAFEVNTQVAGPDARVWDLSCGISRGAGKRQYDRKLNMTLSRDKNDTLRLTGSAVVTAPKKDRMRQVVKLTCQGKLNGSSVDLRVNGNSTNDFAMDGLILVEQIDRDYTLYWKTREPELARSGLDEWKVTLSTKETLRTQAPPLDSFAVPASATGKVSLVMTRSRKDFLSMDLSFSAVTQEYPSTEEPEAALVWEQFDEEKREQLTDWRAILLQRAAAKLMKRLPSETLDGMFLK